MSNTNGSRSPDTAPDPEVDARPKRRRFSAAYKLRILEDADSCKDEGTLGALLRREGLYSSHLSDWRKQRREGALGALERKRGRKPSPNKELEQENARLRRENEQLRKRLQKAEVVIDVQKKLSTLLGVPLRSPENDGSDS